MRIALFVSGCAFAAAFAFAGAANAQSVSVGVQAPDHDSGAVVVEHDHPKPPVVIEHRSATDCSSKKVVVHHGNGDTSTHKRTDCGDQD